MTPYRRSTPPMPVRGNGGTTIAHDVDLSSLTDADFRCLYWTTAANRSRAPGPMTSLRERVTDELLRRKLGAPPEPVIVPWDAWGPEGLAQLVVLMHGLRFESIGSAVPDASNALVRQLDMHVTARAANAIKRAGGAT